jgi:hypothetical protein
MSKRKWVPPLPPLLVHPRVDPNYGCVRVGYTFMTGLNVVLKNVFYPKYNFRKANQGPASARMMSPADMPKLGKLRGHMLDRQVNHMTSLCNNGVSLELLINNKDPQTVMKDKHTVDQVRKFRTKCCGYMRDQMIPYLIDQQLTPVESQCPVADQNTRVGTPIDLVCMDTAGSYVILENKCGFAHYYQRHTGNKMMDPFFYLEDSPEHQWLLYLTFAVSVFERQRHVTVNREKCAVLRMTPNGLQVHQFPMWATASKTLDIAWARIKQQQLSKIGQGHTKNEHRNEKKRNTNSLS